MFTQQVICMYHYYAKCVCCLLFSGEKSADVTQCVRNESDTIGLQVGTVLPRGYCIQPKNEDSVVAE